LYETHDAFSQREIVSDMVELLDSLGHEKAIWVGHDWGAATVWNVASHHPDRCFAVANLCVPYATLEYGLDVLAKFVNRDIYPEAIFPLGNWEYQRFYEEHFGKATAAMEANVAATFKTLFRAGNPRENGKPSALSQVRRDGGWFGGTGAAPDLPRDERIISAADLHAYTSAFERTGFFGTNSLYMNHAGNAAYASEAVNGGYLDLPVLFLQAEFDYTCDCINTHLTSPMTAFCRDLSIHRIESGHWMAQEKPLEVNRHLVRWLAMKAPQAWHLG
jgi:pimeloyl-ACP methyl ester carboxylesterase